MDTQLKNFNKKSKKIMKLYPTKLEVIFFSLHLYEVIPTFKKFTILEFNFKLS
jgi:hypothetical protein